MTRRLPELEVLGPDTSAASGSGLPPLLFVPGLGHSARCWDNWRMAANQAGYLAYAMSLRGHGASTGPLLTSRLGQYRDDVIRVAAQLPAQPVLVGHSMGGLVSLMAAARHRVRGLVLVASVAARPGVGSFLSVARQHPGDAIQMVVGRTLPMRPEYLYEALDRASARRWIAEAGKEAPLAQHQIIFHRPPKAPLGDPRILCVAATADRLVPLTDVKDTARRYGAALHQFDRIGHNMMQDDGWEIVWADVHAWLRRVIR
ncbi:alpha/beta hydrolase [Amycolatopsis deserti]|uniref:Alpha/beta hydrolase n=1 Tax=Amycolatopsis deserti TaxID=185696 RepID=A0ABQ3IDK9_9PSEU|nr:alpha/beta fold hydrolase [Amycolatopsis deserti]GHE76075.1 alpha/beta hydrolase [Amycolatopsis deserti]